MLTDAQSDARSKPLLPTSLQLLNIYNFVLVIVNLFEKNRVIYI